LQRIEAGQAIASIGCDYRGSARPPMRPLIFVAIREGVKYCERTMNDSRALDYTYAEGRQA
jgi:hypothetical protein